MTADINNKFMTWWAHDNRSLKEAGQRISEKIFLAGSFYKKEKLRDIRTILQNNFFEVVSGWLDDHGNTDTEYMPPEDLRNEIALKNEEDIKKCDIFLIIASFSGMQSNTMYEMGFASGIGKQLHFIGEREKLFHFMDKVHHSENLYDWMKQVRESNPTI